MKKKILTIYALFVLITCANAGNGIKLSNEKPNILFCVMDDASIYMSAYEFKWCNTPAFDRLAHKGVFFTNAYTPKAKCAPSRASLLTGRNSWQLEEAANHVNRFPAKFKTFPEVLRENGYVTALTGKGWGPGDPGKKDGKERHDYSRAKNKGYPIRGIVSDDYLYLYNYDTSLRPAGNPEIGYLDIGGSPTKTEIL